MATAANPKIVLTVPVGALPDFTAYYRHDEAAFYCICSKCCIFSMWPIGDEEPDIKPERRLLALKMTHALDQAAKNMQPTTTATRTSLNLEEVRRVVRGLLASLLDLNPACQVTPLPRVFGTAYEDQAWAFIYQVFGPASTRVSPGAAAHNITYSCPAPRGASGVEDADGCIVTTNLLAVAEATYRGVLFEPAP